MKSYTHLKHKLLTDPQIKKAYSELGPQFEVVRAIVKKRMQKGLTQKQLASLIGTKQSAISRFESGSYSPTISFLQKITKALRATIEISIH
jgi:predicted transcriptional regulator